MLLGSPPPPAGYTKGQVDSGDPAAVSALTEAVKLHVLPPIPDWHTVWTTPFMLPGQQLTTLQGAQLEVTQAVADANGTTTVELQAPGSQAHITQADLYACKVRCGAVQGGWQQHIARTCFSWEA